MALSKRLLTLNQTINSGYDHIWDTCCDHGLLGKSLLQAHPQSQIHFVDQVADLIKKIESSLAHSTDKNWQCHSHCVTRLPLAHYAGKHLVIIAGVGGDLIASFITALQGQFSHLAVDYLVCGVHHAYTLRSAMNTLKLSLLDEVLIAENNRLYEVIYVTNQPDGAELSAIGNALWHNAPIDLQTRYLNQLIEHYQKVTQSKPELLNALILYQAKLTSIQTAQRNL